MVMPMACDCWHANYRARAETRAIKARLPMNVERLIKDAIDGCASALAKGRLLLGKVDAQHTPIVDILIHSP